jgi:4-amino-4-deoxy-L-arabinose transferase-like glycosyltransferase
MSSSRNLSLLIILLMLFRLIWMHFSQALPEEAYYWNYALHLDYGYLDHPPMVAYLINCSRKILGNNEWSIRFPAIICWMGMAYFSYQLCEITQKGMGFVAVLLLSVLPFFFLQSMYMTPDLPMMWAWSALLYYLYRALVLDEKKYFYAASVALGLGLLSKYTIVLLGLATFVYIIIVPSARLWWKRKELYWGVLFACIIFSPVIYWNATHQWASFAFQSTQRLKSNHQMTLHYFFLYMLIFILPIGVYALYELCQSDQFLKREQKQFFQIFTLIPLTVFAFLSLIHKIKFNWIGPLFLAWIPWFILLMQRSEKKHYLKHFQWSLKILVPFYALFLGIIVTNQPYWLYQHLLRKLIDWQGLSIELNQLANQYERQHGAVPQFLALDKYNIASELILYQSKALEHQMIKEIYPILGQHVINNPSLMFQFWDKSKQHHGESVILLSWNEADLNSSYLRGLMKFTSPVKKIKVKAPRQQEYVNALYYQYAQLN